MKPTIGRIVIYNTTQEDRDRQSYEGVNGNGPVRITVGNVQMQLPAIIVAVWGDTCVNLKVINDGQNDFWVTSSLQGDGERQWNWPLIEKPIRVAGKDTSAEQ